MRVAPKPPAALSKESEPATKVFSALRTKPVAPFTAVETLRLSAAIVEFVVVLILLAASPNCNPVRSTGLSDFKNTVPVPAISTTPALSVVTFVSASKILFNWSLVNLTVPATKT